ncbi:FtsK/SpoIIIE family protein [Mycobacteroides abscessus subsp. abscessus]|uniref:FtsK/SpoIIIE family protein n=1 Tax=Mycobacteroides abscessus subsp. bolletii TaxID=319705 RepID=A0A9Q7WK82_9MYCO|nr:FtsK/SpoIIIE family protein [Mycobacteroides abscessus subsp. bolletii]SID82321.1 FtsK/SpoIIIE family protein [Mycobacteroides abscessus subsp. abscessus]SHU73728.1 FtsK/SpoIIIE family protein [Mycobacteroides abscessus subsp. bolletii]SHX83396.1 FtsK/SpoIIIE family protein [Mycobacteroides abscessus subsp. bolletii]SIF85603.1 FtsK/SpoIIIE family protein [Mycobacteroides abscessus subsp. abscessus]
MVGVSRQQRRALAARRAEKREDYLWQRGIRMQDARLDALDRDERDAEREYEKLSERLGAIELKARADIDRAVAEIQRQATAEERRVLSTPLTRYTGAGFNRPATWVWHTGASMPDGLARRVGIESREGGPLLVLRAGGGVAESDLAPSVLRAELPELVSDPSFVGWSDGVMTLLPDVARRYSILERLRDDDWLSALLESAGITSSSTSVESVQGVYGIVERKVTTTVVPSLSDVRVTRTGLRLTFAHQPGRSARDWNARIDSLRAGLKAAGLDAGNLRIADGEGGTVVLHTNDVDPFSGTSPESGQFDAERGRSLLGITESGEECWITWSGSSGLVVGGVPGSGKTASLLPVFSGMTGQCELHVFDGKSGFDLHPLRHISSTYDRSGDISAPLETLRKLDQLRTARAEALYESVGANNFWNLSQAQRDQLGVKPVFCVLDECQTWLDQSGMDKEEKGSADEVRKLVRTLVQKGRSAGIIVVLTTQKPDSTSIPTVIRDNAALKICFRVSTPEQAITVLGRQSPGAPDPTEILMSAKGRGVMETEGLGIVLFQAGYKSPAELDDELAQHQPVEDQSRVAARLLGKTQKVVSRPTVPEPVALPEIPVTPPVREADEETKMTGNGGLRL